MSFLAPIRNFAKNIIPPEWQFRIVSAKHALTKFKQTYYSQNGEDIVLGNIFAEKNNGFYVDVGAHHPYRISNTYLLHKRGWSGVNIDANPETISMFKRARPNDINLNVGVGRTSATLPYHRFSDPAVNTFSAVEAEKWKNKKWIEYLGATTVPIKPLAIILDEVLPPNTIIDVCSIDVEGFDLQVLESNDWNRFRPRVIVVEDHSFTLADKDTSPVYQFLTERGFRLENKLQFSLFFKDTNVN